MKIVEKLQRTLEYARQDIEVYENFLRCHGEALDALPQTGWIDFMYMGGNLNRALTIYGLSHGQMLAARKALRLPKIMRYEGVGVSVGKVCWRGVDPTTNIRVDFDGVDLPPSCRLVEKVVHHEAQPAYDEKRLVVECDNNHEIADEEAPKVAMKGDRE